MNLSNIIIILDHPDESRNIGAACRAMANNDLSELRIVGNKSDYDIEHIHVLAIHAGGIFDNAKFFNSIKEATVQFAQERHEGAVKNAANYCFQKSLQIWRIILQEAQTAERLL